MSRRAALIFLLPFLLLAVGCSGLTTLVVENRTGENLTVNVSSKGERAESATLTVPSGFSEESIKWFRTPPEEITVDLVGGKQGRTLKFTHADMPAWMIKGSTGRGRAMLVLEPGTARFRPSNAAERFSDGLPMSAIAPCACLTPVLLICAVLWFARKPRSKRGL